MTTPLAVQSRVNIFRLPVLAASLLCLALADRPPAAAGKGAELLKTDLLGVFAHPDDETGSAATLAAYALGRHATVACVYFTRGDGGGNVVGTQAGPALAVLREAELRDCLARLGVRYCYFLDRPDFGYTEDPLVTLERWDHRESLRRLVRLIRTLRPEVIVTMNPAPVAGQHGHHEAAGQMALEAFDLAADPNWFPEQLAEEGIRVWKARKIYYGGPAGTGATIDTGRRVAAGHTAGQVAAEALANHRSQGFGGFAASPSRQKSPSFTLVKSVVSFATNETDLFRGLPFPGDIHPRVLAAGDGGAPADFEFRFVARPAVDAYQTWVRQQRIEHVAERFATDLPVVAGEENDLFLYCLNSTTNGATTVAHYSPPPGWGVNFEEAGILFSPRRMNRMRVLVTPPAGRPPDAEITATTTILGREFHTTARLHPVPRLDVPLVRSALAIAAAESDPGWSLLPANRISHTDVWQGQAADDADCSGEFRLAHDGTTLFVEVRVRDNVVVSNLAPDDIKAHWRTDSVELCFDPVAGSRHAFGSYKLGIVPFDSTGKVRAARDADARPGPAEQTAPGTRLVSWRTPEGYAIRAAIPFAEIGFQPTPEGRRLGLNVLIYDGDKAGAAPGESNNKTRLAWSPRPGVQGRPEDWGRADLE